MSAVGGASGGKRRLWSAVKPAAHPKGLPARSRCLGPMPRCLYRVMWAVLAQGDPGAGEARVIWLGAEPARLAELHRLSLLLTAVGPARGICA
jgi:hypothetical protein